MSRNNTIDIIRGVAMLMVVLGHTISGSTSEYENTFIFRVIWSLQMPLFFIISGYVTRYSRPIETGVDLWRFVKKRTLAYLLPWVVWTFAVRGFIFGQEDFLDVKYLLWHMDSGYWFLVTLWCIVVIYGISDYLSNKFAQRKKAFNILTHLACMVGGACFLIGVGHFAGMSFLDIKLTLYYIPLYSCGYLYGQLQDSILAKHRATSVVDVIAVLSLAVWLWLLVRFNFYGVDVTVGLLSMRYIASLCGSIFVIYTLSVICKSGGGICCSRKIFVGDIHNSLPVSELAFHRADTSSHDNDGCADSCSELHSDTCTDSYNDNCAKTKQSSFKNTVLQAGRAGISLSSLKWCGVNSLAIYLIHGFFLNLIAKGDYSGAFSIFEIPICGLNYIVCIALTCACIALLNKNTLLSKLLFWK